MFPESIICKSTSISLHFMCVGTAVTAESNVIELIQQELLNPN